MSDKRLIAVGKQQGQRGVIRCEDGEATTVQGWNAWRDEMQRRQARQETEQWELIDKREKERK